MNVWEALILGVVQGLTEFLPVSSSGHLELGKALLGDHSLPQESLMFTLAVHAATALSTLVIFRKDIYEILKGLATFKRNAQSLFSINILISMVPAVVVGLFFEKEIEQLFHQNILLVGTMLLLTGILLIWADRAKNTQKNVQKGSAMLIGLAQAIAILPGISRSGATIATAVLLGIDRSKAARFSFLMVVPLILGSMAKSLLEFEGKFENTQTIPVLVGFVAAFTTGLLACKWMMALVKKSKLYFFACYCFLVGILAISYIVFL